MNVIVVNVSKLVPKEIKDCFRIIWTSSAEINPEVKAKIIGDAEVVTVRPADLIEDQLPEIREEIKEYAKFDEDVNNADALFPQQAKDSRVAAKSILRCTITNSRCNFLDLRYLRKLKG